MIRCVMLLLGLFILPFIHSLDQGDNLLLQPAAFLLVLVLPLALGAAFYRSELLGALWAPWSSTPSPLGRAQVSRAVEILQSLRRLVLASSALGVVLAAIHMLGFLDQPMVFGPGISVTWVAVFYGVFACEFLLAPMTRQVVVRSLQVPVSPSEAGGSATSTALLTLFSLLVLSVGFVAATWLVEGGAFAALLQPVGLLGLMPALLLALGWHSPATVGRALTSAPIYQASDEALQAYHHVLASFRALLYGSAALCHLLGSLYMVAHLASLAKLGVGLAVSLSPWIYATILGELVVGPRHHRIQAELARRNLDETALEQQARTGPGALVLSGLSIAAGLAVAFWTLLYLR